ncbi:hypothetical protein GCM10009662_14480 [Catellatospora coxensis]|uniref:Uncharacterized protein n=1 Tax=Catellatospora coxensis TaxID=310354 RepID=A0A8J3KRT6_9ACTN|nr:hypothetical protein Cco03nite_16420 [Catellatospora coxensis]
MDLATLQAQQTLFIKQRFTMMINRYEVTSVQPDGTPGTQLAFVEQKRMAFKEQVTLYRDDSKTGVFAAFKARSVIDLGATYDVTDENGAPIGLFKKDFAKSLLRSTWHVEPAGGARFTGQERSLPIALLRRFADLTFWPYHFDFVRDGQPVFSVVKKFALVRDKYTVQIHDPAIDRRLVVAMAVALDALQAR